jgi:hypothetical protein
MRRFLTLLDKEWRDVRTIAAACAVLAGGGLFLITAQFRSSELPAIAAQHVLPALAALFMATIAADLVAAETQTRRIETSALLPTRLSTLWTSKAAVLAVTTTLFVAWLVLCQMAAFLLMRPEDVVVTFTRRLVEETWQLGAVAAAGAATLFFSTVLDRGMPSLLLGVAVGGAVQWTAKPAMRVLVDGFEPGWGAVGWFALAVAATLAVGAAAAFTKGRIHCGSRLRRAVVGVLALVLCLVPTQAALAAWTRLSWLAIEPGDPLASIYAARLSPDGRRLALTVSKRRENSHGWVPRACRAWIVDLDDGALHDVGGLSSAPAGWEKDGRLLVRTWTGGGVRESRVDPRTLESVEGDFIAEKDLQSGYAAEAPKCWYDLQSKQGTGPTPGTSTWEYVVTWRDRGVSKRFPNGARCAKTPGLVFVMGWSRGPLVRHELETGVERTLAENVLGGSSHIGPDDARIIASVGDEQVLLDAVDGRRIAGPWPPGTAHFPSSATTSRFVLLRRAPHRRYELVDVDGGLHIDVDPGPWTSPATRAPDLMELPDGRLVVWRTDGDMVLLDREGRLVRTLYATRRTEN